MASDRTGGKGQETQDAGALLERKLTVLRNVLEATRQELLLVDLDALAPLLEHKERLIGEAAAVDEALEGLGALGLDGQQEPGYRTELTRLVEAILENERTLEARMDHERERLRQELRDLDHEARLRTYLERQRPRAGKVNLTR